MQKGRTNMERGLIRKTAVTATKLDEIYNRLVWLPAERELYSLVGGAFAAANDGTWQKVPITEATSILRVCVNASIDYTFKVLDTIANSRTAAGKVLMPIITASKSAYAPETPPTWAGNCTGPIATCMLPLKASDTRWSRAFDTWQGWVDLDPDNMLVFQNKFRYYSGSDGTEIADDAKMQVSAINVRIGLIAYSK